MLELSHVCVSYGDVQVVNDVHLQVANGELVALLGANGAGKTTVLKAISGMLRHSQGTIRFEGREIAGVPSYRRSRQGIVHVPEGRQTFTEMSVIDNLLVASTCNKSQRPENLGLVFDLFPILKQRRSQLAGTLSGGEQQMLGIGRALMCSPKLLILDEPSLGLAPLLVRQVFDVVQRLRRAGLTVLLAEQNITYSLKLCDRAYVMEAGDVVLEGKGTDLLNDERTRKAYIGE